ncbi:uncharacterized protein LOC133531270 [Cydia pomonella]|uniref:uncharacterized protein LOC133531270 n=1 Tax=Cydia pomonella TaxID=82600 RepID=UPI002ADDA5B5|nr:uncharacterized protein LOC133531270 [Cydia pomonella]
MDVNHLHKDELEFELACRGVSDCQTVAAMRKFLRTMLKREASGESSISFKVPIACVENQGSEILGCRSKLATLVTLIREASLSPDWSLIKRIHSRLTHLANRTKLIVPKERDDIESHSALIREIEEARSALDKLSQEASDDEDSIPEHDRAALHRSLGDEAVKILGHLNIDKDTVRDTPKQEQSQPRVEGTSTSAGVELQDKPQPSRSEYPEMNDSHVDLQGNEQGPVLKPALQPPLLQRSSTMDHDFQRRKLVPIKDWGVKFSGRGSVSINAFLERVDELKDARNAGNDDLFRYAIDFFEEEALIWFRANKNSVTNWTELVKLLMDTFQEPNYQDELLEEIKRRTQSRQESVIIYISTMQNMFNRLPEPLTELQKLVILRKNVQPYFQKEICRDSFSTVAELTAVLKVVERTKLTCEKFKEPTQDTYSLERDLAYQGIGEAGQRKQNEVAAIGDKTQSKCWNCRSPGHRFRECSLPRQRLFCYKCGRFGNTIQKCSCNATREGNGQLESMPADQTPRN